MRRTAALLVATLLAAGMGALPIAPATAAASAASELDMSKRAEALYVEGKYADARTAAEQGLAYSEKANGPEGANVAWWLNQLGLVLVAEGEYAKAEQLYKRALAIREKVLGKDHPDTAIVINNLAALYDTQARYAEAEPLYKRALAINEKANGANHQSVSLSLNNLGLLYINQGRYAEAEPLLKRSLAIAEKTQGPDHQDTATGLLNLAALYFAQGRLAEAEALQKRALAIDEKVYGPDHPETATAVNNLAELYRVQGRFAEAEPLFRRALVIDERTKGAASPDVALDLSNLAALAQDLGRFAEAEANLTRALAILEKAFGSDHPLIANGLTNLASLYQDQGRVAEAEPLYVRALAIDEKIHGPDHPDTATSLNNLASFYHAIGRTASAERLYTRALGVYEKSLGRDHERVAMTLNNLAYVEKSQGRIAEATALAGRAVAIDEKALGPDHQRTAIALGVLASLTEAQGKLAEAEALYARALAILQKKLPPGDAQIGLAHYWLSRIQLQRGKAEPALDAARASSKILGDRRARAAAAATRGGPAERLSYENYFTQHVRAAYAAAQAKPQSDAALSREGFEAAQRQSADDTGAALAHTAARFAARNDDLARLLREQQALIARLPPLARLIAQALGASDPAARAQADVFRKESETIAARLAEIDTTLRRDHKAYGDLIDPQPTGVAETQALLKPNEALVLLLIGEEESFLFAVSPTQFRWAKAPVTGAALTKDIATLRRQLNPNDWRTRPLEPFDRALAHRLYTQLWAPLEDVLKDKSQVFVIPTGPLTSLPLSVLVTEQPKGGPAGDGDPRALRDTAWLINRHALTTLPSIASLKALRVYANKGSGSEAFAGFGDPALAAAGPDAAITSGARSVASVFRGSEPDLAQLRKLSTLPATAGELRALAKALGATESDVYLRERATEGQVKSLDLSKKRVVAFATHGLMAGDLGLGEPGLVFTPPASASTRDDGYLAASEAAGLNLKADWIILSACNTAAGETPGANGLSGLARAFFLAGAKSLLVSHWPVWDDVAMRLTTGSVANMAKTPADGRAEALRQAMLAVMKDETAPRFAHPAAWAPFVLVGETRTQ